MIWTKQYQKSTNAITNGTLMRETRVVDFVTQMIDQGKLIGSKRMFLHLVDAEDIIKDLSGPAKWNADWKLPGSDHWLRPAPCLRHRSSEPPNWSGSTSQQTRPPNRSYASLLCRYPTML